MGRYLSVEGARHLVNKVKENFVSSNEPIQAANAGFADTAASANKANIANCDAVGNVIHQTYLSKDDAADLYLPVTGNAVSASNARVAESCSGNSATATRLAAKHTINVQDAAGVNSGSAVSFDGSEDVVIKLPPTIAANISGNATSATKANSDSAGNVIVNHYSPVHNPVFTGSPQAPSPDIAVNNSQIATTQFVHSLFAALIVDAIAGKQDLNSALTSISSLATSADKLIYTNAPDSFVTTDFTQFARALLAAVNAENARNTLGALGKNDNAVSSSFADKAAADSAGNSIINHYAPIDSPALTGTPQAPTAVATADDNQIATTKFVQTAIQNLIGSAPAALDSLFELADAIGKDENFAVTVSEQLATKQNLNPALSSISNLVTSADKLIYTNAPDSFVTADFTQFARALLAAVNAENARNTLDALGKNEKAVSAIAADSADICTGNSATADKLSTARKIFIQDWDGSNICLDGVNFDGSGNVTLKLPCTITAELNGNANSANYADFSLRAERDSDGTSFSEKYMPKGESQPLVITAENWVEDSNEAFKFYLDIDVDNLTASDIVFVNLMPESHGLSVKCGLCPTCEITDGKLRFRSKEIPTAPILGEFHILKGASTNKVANYGSVNTSTSQRVIIYKTPEQTGTLTFNKNVQVPTWDDFDPTKLLMTGEISGIDAKTYTLAFTPIGNCTWSDDTRAPRSQTWEIERAVTTLPSQLEPVVYNGIAQTPRLADFNSDEIILSGDFQNLVDAGTYSAFATPASNYKFDDGSTDTKPFSLTIQKAAQVIGVDKSSLSLENALMSDTVIVNRLGDGVISVSSSDENVVTVSNVDSEVIVSAVATGNATLLIEVAESKNYLPASLTINVDTYVIKPLEQCSPAEIVDAVKSGKAHNAWDAGDFTAPITLNGNIGAALSLNNLQLRAILIGLNHNSDFESNGNFSAHFILGIDSAFIDSNYNEASASGAKFFQHNISVASNGGGWLNSNLRDICDDIFNALPDEWKAVIKPCTKFTDNTGGGSELSENVTSTVDNVFLLSEFEVFGKKSFANSFEQFFQQQYDFFRNGNSKVRFADSSPCYWWLRSPQATNSTSFVRVNSSGSVGSFNARYSLGLVPAFMIAG